jgi:hypothetical protein
MTTDSSVAEGTRGHAKGTRRARKSGPAAEGETG